VADQDGDPADGSSDGRYAGSLEAAPPSAVNGFAYGVVGANLHIYGSGAPVYVLENWRRPASVDPDWLRALPSRLLHARYAVVPFVDRRHDLARLVRWRDDGVRLSSRLLYGPGGSARRGWPTSSPLGRSTTVGKWSLPRAAIPCCPRRQ
jgi:hypothetical protein